MLVLKDVFNLVQTKFFCRGGKSSNQTSTLQTRTSIIHVMVLRQRVLCERINGNWLLDSIMSYQVRIGQLFNKVEGVGGGGNIPHPTPRSHRL